MKTLVNAIGGILGILISWLMGYLDPGVTVGVGDVAVSGGLATTGLAGLGTLLTSMFGPALGEKLLALWGRIRAIWPGGKTASAHAVETEDTAKAGECLLHLRRLLRSDPEAQKMIDDLLVRSMRVCAGLPETGDD